MEGAKDGSTVQLGKHESAVVQIVAKESKSYKAASSSQNGTSTKTTGKAADASKTTQDKVPDTLQQALRKLVLLSQNAVLYYSVLPLYQALVPGTSCYPTPVYLYSRIFHVFSSLGHVVCQTLRPFILMQQLRKTSGKLLQTKATAFQHRTIACLTNGCFDRETFLRFMASMGNLSIV